MAMTLSRLSLLAVFILTACGCSETAKDSRPDAGVSASGLQKCNEDAGCPDAGGPSDPKQVPAQVAVTITNASSYPRYFNAGWALNTWNDPHPTGWLIPDAVLQPAESRSFPASTIIGLPGDEVVIGVSGYYTPDPHAWARGEPRFIMSAGVTSCSFKYTTTGPGGDSAMSVHCTPGTTASP